MVLSKEQMRQYQRDRRAKGKDGSLGSGPSDSNLEERVKCLEEAFGELEKQFALLKASSRRQVAVSAPHSSDDCIGKSSIKARPDDLYARVVAEKVSRLMGGR